MCLISFFFSVPGLRLQLNQPLNRLADPQFCVSCNTVPHWAVTVLYKVYWIVGTHLICTKHLICIR